METAATLPEGTANKQTMKILYRKNLKISQSMEFLGTTWNINIVDKNVDRYDFHVFHVDIIANSINTAKRIFYNIRFIRSNSQYISLNDFFDIKENREVHVQKILPKFDYLDLLNFFDFKNEVIIEVDLYVKEQPVYQWAKNYHLFSEGSSFPYDCILLINGKHIRVHKKFLSMHSAYFKSMFESEFREKNQTEIELEDVDFNEFIELLSAVYPIGHPICVSNVECLLKLADHFTVLDVLSRCEQFLQQDSNIENFKKILLAQQYRLGDLQEYCASQYQQPKEFKELKANPEYALLNEKTKSIMLDSFMRSVN